MSLNSTPASDRIHIGIFGRRNAGKSSLINAITGQNLAIVSDIKGTTTDPVPKSMELLPLGPVIIYDTPGLDDTGDLGHLRIQKARQILNKTDIAVLVINGETGICKEDFDILQLIQQKDIPYIIAVNKKDLCPDKLIFPREVSLEKILYVSAAAGENIQQLKNLIGAQVPEKGEKRCIAADLAAPGDFVILVIPLDKAAPKGRLILPQQQTIRDLLDHGIIPVMTRDTELEETLHRLMNAGIKPGLVITDSQIFSQVSAIVPKEIPLTSFSILFARYKGNLTSCIHGAETLDILKDGDTVLISEGCTHHRQCGDIGTVKLPALLRKHTRKELNFVFTSGTEFPENLSPYKVIIHCGGCMLNDREMKYRQMCAADQNIPMTNYGIAIAHMKGILKRSIEML